MKKNFEFFEFLKRRRIFRTPGLNFNLGHTDLIHSNTCMVTNFGYRLQLTI